MIGKQVRTLRKQNGVDQKNLAKILDIKQASLSDYENNKTNTPDDIKFKLCDGRPLPLYRGRRTN